VSPRPPEGGTPNKRVRLALRFGVPRLRYPTRPNVAFRANSVIKTGTAAPFSALGSEFRFRAVGDQPRKRGTPNHVRVSDGAKNVQKKTKKVVDSPLRLWNSLATHGNIQIQNNMRTKTLLAAAAMLAAGFASSMAQSNVYSLNVVGYVNRVIPGPSK